MTTTDVPVQRGEWVVAPKAAIPGPVSPGWAEGTLTRAGELEALADLAFAGGHVPHCASLRSAMERHITAARDAAEAAGRRNAVRRALGLADSHLLERATSNLDAAEAQLLDFAPASYLLGQMPSLLNHVRCHLVASDPRRQTFERIARKAGVVDAEHPLPPGAAEPTARDREAAVSAERDAIVAATRAASSAALREQVRLRSFRLVLAITTLALTVLAIGVAVTGFVKPTLIPLCFAPEEAGQAQVVCPTAQSESFPTDLSATAAPDIDDFILSTATRWDLSVVLLIGLTAAALAAATAIRGIKGSSERHGIPVAMALLKLPTGAITAFLGLLLMRGQFVPGLSALDTSAQILAWAIIFGYAQQLFTRLIDKQGHTVLDSVRGADNAQRPAQP